MTATSENGSSRADSGYTAPTFVPPADIFETKQAVIMFLDLPGADPDSLEVTFENRELTISAQTAGSAPEGYTLMHAEYREGNYERAFTLSENVDGDRIEAVIRNGVLRLMLPKTDPSPAKKIEVKTA
jgi:HSP20 family molecular chaperone IbpA